MEGSDRGLRYLIGIPFYPHPVVAFDWVAGSIWCAPSGAEYRFFKLDIQRHDTLARIEASGAPVPVRPGERDTAIARVRKFLATLNEPDPTGIGFQTYGR